MDWSTFVDHYRQGRSPRHASHQAASFSRAAPVAASHAPPAEQPAKQKLPRANSLRSDSSDLPITISVFHSFAENLRSFLPSAAKRQLPSPVAKAGNASHMSFAHQTHSQSNQSVYSCVDANSVAPVDPPYTKLNPSDIMTRPSSLTTASLPEHVRRIAAADFASFSSLGEGVYGRCHRTRMISNALQVVVKCLKSDVDAAAEGSLKSQLMNEIALAVSIPVHPNVLPLVGICEDLVMDGHAYQLALVTPYIAGGTLHDAIRSQTKSWPSPLEWLRLAHDATAALQHLHAHHIVHRDVAPRNLLIERSSNGSSRLVLSDFGMSRLLLPSTDHGAEVYTMTHDAVVPIRWMAPECLRDRQFTAASDVWALGVTMYQCVTRCSLPYGDSQNALQIAIGVVTGSLVLHIDESIPPLIADWIKLCLKPEPAARPSCTQLLAMLDVMMKQLQCP